MPWLSPPARRSAEWFLPADCPELTMPGLSRLFIPGLRSVSVLNIYVGNLSFDTGDSELQELFAPHGEVGRASVITDRETGRSRGFGFVEMSDAAAGRAAIEAWNGQEFGGRALTVNEAKPRGEGGGGGGGGGRRDRY